MNEQLVHFHAFEFIFEFVEPGLLSFFGFALVYQKLLLNQNLHRSALFGLHTLFFFKQNFVVIASVPELPREHDILLIFLGVPDKS